MTFKKIVGFGDSWMYGDELLDPELLRQDPTAHTCFDQNTPYRERNCFLGQIATHYGVSWENFGIPGGSLQSTIWTFLWWLEHETLPLEDCLVLVALTNSDRISHYNPNHVHYSNDPPWNKFVHSTWVNFGSTVIEDQFKDMIKQQLVLTNCKEFCQLNYQQAVMLFDGVAARKSLNLYQFNVMLDTPPLDNIPTLLWPRHSLVQWFVQELQPKFGRIYVEAQGHPNVVGHGLIRDRLLQQIQQ
jgi:hypothetical protein